MLNGTNGSGEADGRFPLRAGQDPLAMAAYSEDDEAATQIVEGLHEEPKWIVRVTALDRRLLSTEQLLNELGRGGLVRPDTLVWRSGLSNWQPIARLEGLPGASRLDAAALSGWERDGSGAPSPSGGVLASSAIALLAASLTLYALSRAGVFDTDANQRPRPGESFASTLP